MIGPFLGGLTLGLLAILLRNSPGVSGYAYDVNNIVVDIPSVENNVYRDTRDDPSCNSVGFGPWVPVQNGYCLTPANCSAVFGIVLIQGTIKCSEQNTICCTKPGAVVVPNPNSTDIPSFPATPNFTTPNFPAAPNFTTPSFPAAPNFTTPSFPAAPNFTTPSFPAAPNFTTPSFPAAPNLTFPALPSAPNYTVPTFPTAPNLTFPAVPTAPNFTTPTLPTAPNFTTPTLPAALNFTFPSIQNPARFVTYNSYGILLPAPVIDIKPPEESRFKRQAPDDPNFRQFPQAPAFPSPPPFPTAPNVTYPQAPAFPNPPPFPSAPNVTYPEAPAFPSPPPFPTVPNVTYPQAPALPTPPPIPTAPNVTYPQAPAFPNPPPFPSAPNVTYPEAPAFPSPPPFPTAPNVTYPQAPAFPNPPPFPSAPNVTYPEAPAFPSPPPFPTAPNVTYPQAPALPNPPTAPNITGQVPALPALPPPPDIANVVPALPPVPATPNISSSVPPVPSLPATPAVPSIPPAPALPQIPAAPSAAPPPAAAPAFDEPVRVPILVNECKSLTGEVVSNFTNPPYPKLTTKPLVCQHIILTQPGFCGLRVRIVEAAFAPKEGDSCSTDSLQIINSLNSPAVPQCGLIAGYQFTVKTKPALPVTLLVTSQSPKDLWRIQATQIPCANIKPINELQADDCGRKGSHGSEDFEIPDVGERVKIMPALKLLEEEKKSIPVIARSNDPKGPQELLRKAILRYPQQVKIVRGNETGVNEWPWQVLLLINGRPLCGGSLINDRWVVTAGHCVALTLKYPLASIMVVDLGDHDLRTTKESNSKIYKLEAIVPHIQHDQVGYDIAMLKLKTKAVLSEAVRPVCLPEASDADRSFAGETAISTGWGKTEAAVISPVLRQAELPILSNEDCRASWGLVGAGGEDLILPGMICVGGGDVGPCNGDSGGPLVIQDPKYENKWRLIGLTSFGAVRGCGIPGIPSVYTRVTTYLDWIALNLAEP